MKVKTNPVNGKVDVVISINERRILAKAHSILDQLAYHQSSDSGYGPDSGVAALFIKSLLTAETP